MKNKQSHCPGCSRHCPMHAVRCKYGKNYFAKLESAQEKKAEKRSWKKSVAKGGLTWQFLRVSRKTKKDLKNSRLTEQQLLSRLSESEQAQLRNILDKLSNAAT